MKVKITNKPRGENEMKKSSIMSILLVGLLTVMASSGPIPPGPIGNFINNSAAPQTGAQFNVSSATVRGPLTASNLVISTLNVVGITAGQFVGGGIGLTNLNPAEVKSGTIPASVVWHGAPVGVAYGGTGQNFSAVTQGKIPYFSGTGVMGVTAAGTPNQVLQSGGPAGSPSFTSAPTILGTNVTAIPPANLAAGTLSALNPAAAVTVSGVTAGVYGGPTISPQITIGADGRVSSATQFSIPGASPKSTLYDLPYTWTAPQHFVSSFTVENMSGVTMSGNLIVGASVQANIVQPNSIDFNPISAPEYREGRIYYDNNAKTLTVYSDTPMTSLNVGEELWVTALNNTGSIIPDGSIVYINGASGDLPTIALARADTYVTSRLVGVTTMPFGIGGRGKVTVYGIIHDLNTAALTGGSIVYLSTFTAGNFSLFRPTAPNYDARIGVCLKQDGATGEILINPDLSVRVGMGGPNQHLGMNAAGTEEEYKTMRSTDLAISAQPGFMDWAIQPAVNPSWLTSIPESKVTNLAGDLLDLQHSTGTLQSQVTANTAALSTAAYLPANNIFTGSNTMSGPLTLSGSSLTVRGNALEISGSGSQFIAPASIQSGYGALIGNIDNHNTANGLYISNAYNTSATYPLRIQSNVATKADMFAAVGVDLLYVKGDGTVAVPGNNFIVGGSTLVVANGNVGIGAVSPISALEVVGKITNDGALSGMDIFSGHYNPADGNMALHIGGDLGNVVRSATSRKSAVINTPSYTLSGHPTLMFWQDNNTTTSDLLIGGGNGYQYASTHIGLFTAANNTTDAGTERLTILSNGNVGIGTTSPSSSLHIKEPHADSILETTAADDYAVLKIVTPANDLWIGKERSVGGGIMTGSLPYAGVIVSPGNYPLQLGVADNAKLTILGSGNVGIGDTAPQAKLVVNGNIVSSGTISGNGVGITGVEIHASSSCVPGTSIASTTDIGLATATIVLRGGRNYECIAHANINNASGGTRTYTYNIYKNSVPVGDGATTGNYVYDCSGASTCNLYMPYDPLTNSVAGNTTFALVIRSSSATGTQTALHASIRCQED